MIRMYLLPIYLYSVSSILLLLFGRSIGYRGSAIISCSVGLVCTLLSYLIFFEVSLNKSSCSIELWHWVYFDIVNVRWGFLFDVISTCMLLIITTVSWCATAYSVEYMCDDPHINRFLAYLCLFTCFMFFLVTSNNLIQLFVGWEGVGICSYLLINFWFTRTSANKAALLAVFVNKIGDIALLVSFGLIFYTYKTFDVSVILGMSELCREVQSFFDPICYLFLVGAVAKSAQLGLHVWLPEAMEGPTPVSSLIHAATMVTAGIFLLVRFSFMLEKSPTVLVLCICIGAMTVFFGSSIGMFLFDIKRIVAYSTCSQLGYMFMSCGFCNYSYAMFHLIGHAFFKALLFLTAGYIIHFCGGEQDFRKIGGLLRILPAGYVFLLIGSLSLVGFPFLSGFITKEALLEAAYGYDQIIIYDISSFCQFLALFSILFSIIYSVRLLTGIFFGLYNGFKHRLPSFHYAGILVLIPLFKLCCFSIFFGYISKDFFVGYGSYFLAAHQPIQELDLVTDAQTYDFLRLVARDSCATSMSEEDALRVVVRDPQGTSIKVTSNVAVVTLKLPAYYCLMLPMRANISKKYSFALYLAFFKYVEAHMAECRQSGCSDSCPVCHLFVKISELPWYSRLWMWIKSNCYYMYQHGDELAYAFEMSALVTLFVLIRIPFANVDLKQDKEAAREWAEALHGFYIFAGALALTDKVFRWLLNNFLIPLGKWFDNYFFGEAKKAISEFFRTPIEVDIHFGRCLDTGAINLDYPIIFSGNMFKTLSFQEENGVVNVKVPVVREAHACSEFDKNIRGILALVSTYFFLLIYVLFAFMRRCICIYKLKFVCMYYSMCHIITNKYAFFHIYLVSGIVKSLLTYCIGVILVTIEKGVLEYLTGYGLSRCIRQLVLRHTRIKTGIVYHYAGFFLFATIVGMLVLF